MNEKRIDCICILCVKRFKHKVGMITHVRLKHPEVYKQLKEVDNANKK